MKPKAEEKTIFWINTYNFLTLFSLILKKEIPGSEYQFNNIMKNTFYNIGNYVLSVESIEEIIIKGNYNKSKKKDSFIDNNGIFLNTNTFANIEEKYLLLALSKPFK